MIEEYEKALKEKIAQHDEVLRILSDLFGNGALTDGLSAIPPNISTDSLFALHDREIQLAEEVNELFDKLRLSRAN